MKSKETLVREALQALYLEVDASIASDVQNKVLEAFIELKELKELQPCRHVSKYYIQKMIGGYYFCPDCNTAVG